MSCTDTALRIYRNNREECEIVRFIIFAAVIFLLCAVPIKCEKEHSIVGEKDDDIIRLSICADDCREESKNLLISLGHAFLKAENLTERSLGIHGYELAPHGFITFSWWAVDAHFGIWFNIEPSYKASGRYKNIRSLSMYINESELALLNNYMAENDSYSPLGNCAKHVAECWNLLAEPSEKMDMRFIMTPTYIISQTDKFEESTFAGFDSCPDIAFIKDGKTHYFGMVTGG